MREKEGEKKEGKEKERARFVRVRNITSFRSISSVLLLL